jgi:hypothetical protein
MKTEYTYENAPGEVIDEMGLKEIFEFLVHMIYQSGKQKGENIAETLHHTL